MAKYQKVENCGPVPYPDQSGRFLAAGETAEGDAWEPLVMLGFVKRIESSPKAVEVSAPMVTEPSAPAPMQLTEEDPDKMGEHTQEASDGMQANDGSGTQAMDPSEAGKPGNKGMPGRPPTRRRS